MSVLNSSAVQPSAIVCESFDGHDPSCNRGKPFLSTSPQSLERDPEAGFEPGVFPGFSSSECVRALNSSAVLPSAIACESFDGQDP